MALARPARRPTILLFARAIRSRRRLSRRQRRFRAQCCLRRSTCLWNAAARYFSSRRRFHHPHSSPRSRGNQTPTPDQSQFARGTRLHARRNACRVPEGARRRQILFHRSRRSRRRRLHLRCHRNCHWDQPLARVGPPRSRRRESALPASPVTPRPRRLHPEVPKPRTHSAVARFLRHPLPIRFRRHPAGAGQTKFLTSFPAPHSALHLLQIPSLFSWTAHQPWHALSQSLVTVWNSSFTHCLPRTLPGNTVCSTPDGILRWGGAVSLGGPMWGNKKPDAAQAGQPETRNLQTNQPPKPAPATWEDKPAMSTDAMRPLGATADRATARLGASLHVPGALSGNEDLLIDGSVEGLIQLDERKLIVGTTAKVTADIIAREVVVFGNVKGNLRAKDKIEIKKDGSVNGDLTTARIMIEDGAYFKGSIEIDKGSEKESGTSAFARASSAPAGAAASKTI